MNYWQRAYYQLIVGNHVGLMADLVLSVYEFQLNLKLYFKFNFVSDFVKILSNLLIGKIIQNGLGVRNVIKKKK